MTGYDCCDGSGFSADVTMALRKLVGVLGGMGPLATVDFMQKVIAATPAERDQDHVPMLVYSVPQIPDRVAALSTGSDEPFPALVEGLRTLERGGVKLIVMPCNTAHAWFDRLAASVDVDLLHIGDAVRQRAGDTTETIALMATTGTVRAGFYQRYLATAQRHILLPAAGVQELINKAIAAVKIGDLNTARICATSAAESLVGAGTNRILLACTELPLALAGAPVNARCLDATVCLAEACVSFSRGMPLPAALGSVKASRHKEAGPWISDGCKTS
jgi:aspartate racemase